MSKSDEILKILEEIARDIKDIKSVDVKSYQIGVFEGLRMALEILGQPEHKNN